MKSSNNFILFFLFCSIFLSAQEDQFFKGNHLFEQGNYVQACHAYKSIKNPGFSVLYNIALSYLHQENIAQALLFVKRAEKQATFQELTELNELVDCIQRRNDPNFQISLYEQLAIFWKKCILSISMLWLQLVILMMMLLLIICWYMGWYSMHRKKIIGTIFLCIFCLLIFMYKIFILQQQVAIVINDTICLYAGPDQSFYKKDQLYQSDQVTIVSKQQKYYQVKTQQVIGWVCDDDIELV